MTAAQIIREIDCLPPAERSEVVRYARRLDTSRQLSGEELGMLAEKMIAATDPAEVERLKAEITKGFYGDE
jgi:Arc/MetJ-type ribon-helix-helix transcriptional regulator